MVAASDARRIALALPEVTEQDHHGIASFRVRGKIFATVPDELHFNIMLTPEDIQSVAAMHAGSCEELFWGKRLAALRVTLDRIDRVLLSQLLEDAWSRKAPRALTRMLVKPPR